MEIAQLYTQALRAKTAADFQTAIDAIPQVHRIRILHTMASFHCHPEHPTAKSRRIIAGLEKEYIGIIKN